MQSSPIFVSSGASASGWLHRCCFLAIRAEIRAAPASGLKSIMV